MRRHFYLVVDSPKEEFVGGVDIRERRYEVAKKNEERPIQKRNLETNEQYVERVVSLGYADFDDQDDYDERAVDVTMEKLAEIDERHLVNAGLDPDDVFDRDEQEAAA